MKKLTLDVDALEVESFATDAARGRGTVRALGATDEIDCFTQACPPPSAAQTCACTVAGQTCGCPRPPCSTLCVFISEASCEL